MVYILRFQLLMMFAQTASATAVTVAESALAQHQRHDTLLSSSLAVASGNSSVDLSISAAATAGSSSSSSEHHRLSADLLLSAEEEELQEAKEVEKKLIHLRKYFADKNASIGEDRPRYRFITRRFARKTGLTIVSHLVLLCSGHNLSEIFDDYFYRKYTGLIFISDNVKLFDQINHHIKKQPRFDYHQSQLKYVQYSGDCTHANGILHNLDSILELINRYIYDFTEGVTIYSENGGYSQPAFLYLAWLIKYGKYSLNAALEVMYGHKYYGMRMVFRVEMIPILMFKLIELEHKCANEIVE